MKNINHKLRGMGCSLDTLYEQENEAGPRPLSEELIASSAPSSESSMSDTLDAIQNIPCIFQDAQWREQRLSDLITHSLILIHRH